MALSNTVAEETPVRMTKSDSKKEVIGKTVRFAGAKVIDCPQIELTEEESDSLFYDKEYMKKLYRYQVQLARSEEERGSKPCWRGLEHFQKENTGRSNRIDEYVFHVLNFHDNIFFSGTYSTAEERAEALREESRKRTKEDRKRAFKLASQDAFDAQQNQLTEAQTRILEKSAKALLSKQNKKTKSEKQGKPSSKSGKMSQVLRSGLTKLRISSRSSVACYETI